MSFSHPESSGVSSTGISNLNLRPPLTPRAKQKLEYPADAFSPEFFVVKVSVGHDADEPASLHSGPGDAHEAAVECGGVVHLWLIVGPAGAAVDVEFAHGEPFVFGVNPAEGFAEMRRGGQSGDETDGVGPMEPNADGGVGCERCADDADVRRIR
mgnify:CR=1 FL=1